MAITLGLRRWVLRPWALEVACSATELAERLASRTSARGYSWYLASSGVSESDPVFRGRVTADRAHVARFEATLGRNSFVAWLDADICPSPNGGARLDGTIGLANGWSFLWPWMVFGNIIVFGGWFAFAIRLLGSGRPLLACLLVVVPAVFIAGEFFGLGAGIRSMRADRHKLDSTLRDALR